MLSKISESYKLWHSFLPKIEKISRYTLGQKIDAIFLETIELILLASYASRSQKSIIVQKASAKLDTLKFFLQISWELKILDNNKYLRLATQISEVGKMLGGWLKQLQKETPPNCRGE